MILALDIATITGWARRTEDGIIFGTRDFSAVNHDHAVLGRRFHWWLADLITEQGHPSGFVIERPFFMQRSPEAGILLHKLAHEAHRVAEAHDLPRWEYTPGEIKRHVTGKYRAKKHEVMKAIRELGHKIRDENQADAVALLLLHEDRIK